MSAHREILLSVDTHALQRGPAASRVDALSGDGEQRWHADS